MGAYRSQPDTEKHTDEEQLKNICTVGASMMCGWRISQEDAHVVYLTEELCIFAVFDGHGGDSVSKRAGELLVKHCLSQKKKLCEMSDPEFQDLILDFDALIKKTPQTEHAESGATSVISFVFPKKDEDKMKYVIKVCNSGDSRAVCYDPTNPSTIKATIDHKPTDEAETNRVIKAGGHISMDRVNGDLALSRALGDTRYKEAPNIGPKDQAITADPDVYTWEAKQGDTLILACDGIYDVLTNQQLYKYITKNAPKATSLGNLCEMAMDHCMCDNPTQSCGVGADNMTIMVIDLSGTDTVATSSNSKEDQKAQTDQKD